MSQKRLRFLRRIQETEKSFEWANLRRYTQRRRGGNDISQCRSNDYLQKYRIEVMFRPLKKHLVAIRIAAITIGQVAPAFADSADILLDMGTSAGSTLSI
ncbi:hypothetical protein Q2378_27480, partial [Escherichia coli]|nr:hypothetical protein [Escherichia coli]